MPAFFPTPYPDEILYSVLARYGLRAGYTSPKQLLQDLFGVTSISAVIDLPGCIVRLSGRLPSLAKYSAEEFVYKHTLFPFYAPFLPLERARTVFEAMLGDNGGSIHTMTGIMASTFHEPQSLRFCPECNKTDYLSFGEYYWHRVHQVPGVMVCPEHRVLLLDSNVPYRRNNKHEFIPALPENCPVRNAENVNGKTFERLLQLALDCEWLLYNQIGSRPLNWFRDRYIIFLANKGLVSPKGFIDQASLLNEVTAFFGLKALSLLDSESGIANETGWLQSIVRKHRKAFHPIRHLLLIQFLSGSVESFFAQQHAYKPFGDPPWPCLNPAASHYMQPEIDNVQVTRCGDTGRAVGTFSCSCGFVYSRRGPDTSLGDRLKAGRIKAFGQVWESKLERVLRDPDVSLREAGRRMGCDPKTVVKYAKKMGIPVNWSMKVPEPDSRIPSQNADLLTRQRCLWINLIAVYQELTVTKLRAHAPGLYVWLYRHDREWLRDVSPSGFKHENHYQRVDWPSRDDSIVAKAQQAVNNLLLSDAKPRRITVGTVGNMIQARALLEKHLDKLPKTKKYLESTVETTDHFRCRRIRWVAECLDNKGEQVTEWKLLRLAGIRPGFSDKVAAELERQVCLYSMKRTEQFGR